MTASVEHITPPANSASAASAPVAPEIATQSAKLLGHYAGYAATWTIRLGLDTGLLATIAAHPDGLTGDQLSAERGFDPLYTLAWCRAAYAAGLLDLAPGARYKLAPHISSLLLDSDAPTYVGGISRAFVAMRETLLELPDLLKSGRRAWWSDFRNEWIDAVGDTGQSFYSRMLKVVFPRLNAVHAALQAGAHVLDLACGTCNGPIKIARAYPDANFTAIDADEFTIERAGQNLARVGMIGRFKLRQSMLENVDLREAADVAIINISLHEARDIGRVVENAHRALRKGGTFIVSEFPFPESIEGCRTLPAQILCAIQFFEAHIGCQLLPTNRYVNLLREAGFDDVGTIEATPVHVVIHGTK